MTIIWPPCLCHTKIKVLQLVFTQIVQIENIKDYPHHSHPLKQTNRLKRSDVVQTLIEEKAFKSYPQVAIIGAVKEYAKTIILGTSV